jgi:integrase
MDWNLGEQSSSMQTINRLTAVKVTNAKRRGLLADGGGLYLKVTKTGSKSWVFRYKADGVSHDMGLGPVGTISLARARDLAAEARRQRLEGRDPMAVRTAAQASERFAAAQGTTFKTCAEQFLASHEPGWRSAKHREQWHSTLKNYIFPLIGEEPISAIDTERVLRVLQQPIEHAGKKNELWNAMPETGSRIRGRIEAVLSYAKAKGMRAGENPAQWRGHMDQLLPARKKVRRIEHYPALPYAEVPTFMGKLREVESIAARALEFLVLTVARLDEAREAPFEEFNLDRAVWIIPAPRMKGAREHRVPLSARAVAIVKQMAEVRTSDASEFVFPGMKPGRPISPMPVSTLLRCLHETCTVHGFRSSFKDWANETTSFPDHLSEAALAHVSSDRVRSAYARSDLFEKRRELMDAWERHCMGPADAGRRSAAKARTFR